MGKSIEEISNRAFELAQQYEKKCTGCCQTTIAVFLTLLILKMRTFSRLRVVWLMDWG